MTKYLKQFISWLRGLGRRKTYAMAIVRRYTDANGAYVGELYVLGTFCGVLQYNMVGVSLDTLPFAATSPDEAFDLDTEHDFLAPMPKGCVRVGAQEPRDNDTVRASIARMAKSHKIVLQIQNRFVEHILQSGSKSGSEPGKGDK